MRLGFGFHLSQWRVRPVIAAAISTMLGENGDSLSCENDDLLILE